MGGDVGYSFQPFNLTFNYWKSVYQQQMKEETVLVFFSGSNASHVMSLHLGSGSLELSTVTMSSGSTILKEDVDRVIFVTGPSSSLSSPIDDKAAWTTEWKDRHPSIILDDDNQHIVQYNSKEQLFSTVLGSIPIGTDRGSLPIDTANQ